MIYRYIPGPLKAAALLFSVGAILTGCAGVVDHSEQNAKERLELARTAYGQAKADPLVEAYSLKTLLEAEKALQEAEKVRKKAYAPNPLASSGAYDASEKKAFYNDISRLAYMAERKSQTSVALAEGVVARNDIVKLGKKRAEVQLQKSQVEQKLLRQDLADKAAALERAKQQLSMATSETERARITADIQAQEAALANALAQAKAREADLARAEADDQARAAGQAKGEAQAQALAAELAQAEAQAQARAAELAQAEAQDQARAAERAKAEAQAQARAAEDARVELALLMVEMSELQGQLTDRGIVLTIGDVLFATGKSNLNASAQRSMVKLAEFLQKKPNRNLLVEGHTDNVGSDAYNQGLSEQRAVAVKSALVKSGIAGERIVTVGYSMKYPLTSNNDAAGKQQNRRVEAIILNEGVRPESQFRK